MINVNGVVSLLDTTHATRLREIWRMLEECCGLKGKNTEMPPHLTWQVVERYDLAQLEPQMRAWAQSCLPFVVRTAGLGVFSGSSPILYLQIVKDAHLLHLHQQIWQSSQCCAVGPSPYYAPNNWVPHLSLAVGNVNAENLACAFNRLAFEPFEWQIRIDNIALLCPDRDGENKNGLLRIPLGGCACGA